MVRLSTSRWAAVDLRRWGVPFKLTLMGMGLMVLLVGEGVLDPRFLPPVFFVFGLILYGAEHRQPGPGGLWRCHVALQILVLLVCFPAAAGWWPWTALAGAIGLTIGLLVFRDRSRS